jgi:hypothetical protein
MDYEKVYFSLINSRKNFNREKNVIYERHHILPKCLGGKDIR